MKRIFYFTDVLPILAKGEAALDKLEKNLNLFREYKDKAELIWHPWSRIEEYLEINASTCIERYRRIVQEYSKEGWGILDESKSIPETGDVLRSCDIYYGDVCDLVYEACGAGISVMIQRFEDEKEDEQPAVLLQYVIRGQLVYENPETSLEQFIEMKDTADEFPDEFFRDEVRDGFMVSEIMKRSWASQMKILKAITDICDRHDLTYYAEVGTLLGTVRHKGYIPWDDDLDIAMPRRDYMEFLKLEKELPEDLCIRSFYNVESFSSYHAVVSHKAEVLSWDVDRMRDYYGCPFICFVDVFPLDYMAKDPEQFKIQKQLYYFSYKMAYDCKMIEEELFGGRLVSLEELESLSKKGESSDDGAERVKTFMTELKELMGYLRNHLDKEAGVDPGKGLRNQLFIYADRVAQRIHREDADAVDYSPNLALGEISFPRNVEWYRERIEMPFENMTIMTPVEATQELMNQYGEGYMDPRRFLGGHGYPFFRTEMQVFVGGDTGDRYVEIPGEREFQAALDALMEAQNVVRGYTYTLSLEDYLEDNGVQAINYEAAINVLADIQTNAAAIGENIEKAYRKEAYPIPGLEAYCEGIYELSCLISDGVQRKEIFEKENENDALLIKVKQELFREIHRKLLEDESGIPEGWEEVLFAEDGQKKRIVLYGLSATDVINAGSLAEKKLRKVKEDVLGTEDDGASGSAMIICVPEKLAEFIRKCALSMYGGFMAALNEYRNDSRVVFCGDISSAEAARAIYLCDEYYGDRCRLQEVCEMAGKPVTTQDYQDVVELI